MYRGSSRYIKFVRVDQQKYGWRKLEYLENIVHGHFRENIRKIEEKINYIYIYDVQDRT